MRSFVTRKPSARVVRAATLLGIATLAFLTYGVPFFGFVASVCLPIVTHGAREQLWRDESRAGSLTWSVVAWLGLWLPGLVDFASPVFYNAGVQLSTSWLIIPLCGPEGTAAVVLPALAAAGTCSAGLLGSMATRRAWPWVLTAWLASWVHMLVFDQLPHEFIC